MNQKKLNSTQMILLHEIIAKLQLKTNVFVVHGRNEKIRQSIFSFLKAIGLNPMDWDEMVHKTGQASPYIGDVLAKGFELAQAAVVVMTPDDEARLKPDLWAPNEDEQEKEFTAQARPNVLVEAGMALALHEKRTVLVEFGKLRRVSDLFGRHVVSMNNSVERRRRLLSRIETAECKVALIDEDWMTIGDFDL